MRRSLKATTAILASLNLALPLPALAQAGQTAEEPAPPAEGVNCTETPDDPVCATVADPAGGEAAPQAEPAPAEPPTESTPEDPATGGTAAPATESAPAPEQGESPTAETGSETPAVEPESPVEPVPEAQAEPAAPDETGSDATADDGVAGSDSAPTAGEGGTADTDGSTAQGSTSTTMTEDEGASGETGDEATSSEGAPAVEAPAADAPAGDTGAGPDTADLEEALRQDAEGADGEAAEPGDPAGTSADAAPEGQDLPEADQAPGTQDTQAGTEPAAGTSAEGTGSSPDGPNAQPQVGETAGTEGQGTATGDDTAGAEGGTASAEGGEATAGETAAIEGAAPTAAAAAEDAPPVETESTTVTEETARSSSEDFESRIQQLEAADAERRAAVSDAAREDGDGGGLSTLEKGLLLGAGALAVGAVLNNNRRVVASADDRVVVSRGEGDYELIKDDNAILARPGSQVETQTFDDGSSRTTVAYDDGSRIVTIRDADLRVLRRERITPNGERIVLIDDLGEDIRPVDVQRLRQTAEPARTVDLSDEQALREALSYERNFDRAYSLSQVRSIQEVRSQVPAVDLEAITFDTGSAAIRPEQAEQLRALGSYIRQTIEENPRAVFLVEGHTDAVGDAAYNLALSDRRAESVALALGEYFDVPTSNLVVQGYGERFPKVETEDAERANRRATVRNITPLLQAAAAN